MILDTLLDNMMIKVEQQETLIEDLQYFDLYNKVQEYGGINQKINFHQNFSQGQLQIIALIRAKL